MRQTACELFQIGDDETECVAVIGVAVQRLGVQHELSAPGRGDRGGNRDLATELVGSPCFAVADALHLRGVQRIDLRAPLTLLLVANTQREIEQRAEAVFEHGAALDLAANVTDDAAKPHGQEPQLPSRTLELVRMRIAADHDGGALGHPPIALAQFDALTFGQTDQLLDRAVGEPSIGGMRDRFLLHGRVRMNSSATSRVGSGGCPDPTRHTERNRPARKSQSVSPASRTNGWRRLMISASGGRNRSS
jgi:hypothetical protein